MDDAVIKEEDYIRFVRPYEDAQKSMYVRLEALNEDYRRNYQNYPIHNMQRRIKGKESIENKLRKRGLEVGAHAARDWLTDIAGIRIICYLIRDVYEVVSRLKKQADTVLIKESDYISSPKPNGYRSYHIVFGVPVYYSDGMEYYPVEIQLRTMSMDLWASMEHRICYKTGEEPGEGARARFREYAGMLQHIEVDMNRWAGP